MEEGKEKFLSRWSRLKRAAATQPPSVVPPAAGAAIVPAVLPPLESLDFSSDFAAFLHPKVEESVKRAALTKLFHSGPFNQMDGLDVYIDDYGKFESIPEEVLRQLLQAHDLLDPVAEQPAATTATLPEIDAGPQLSELAAPELEPPKGSSETVPKG